LYLSGSSIDLGGASISFDSGTNTFEFTTPGNTTAAVSLGSNDTDDLTEGSTNLYYTNARVNTYLGSGNATSLVTTGDVTVGGNFTVNGTTTTLNTATLDVEDLNITLASGAINAAAADGAGLTIAGANATLTYNSSTDAFDFNKNMTVVGDLTVDTNTLFVDAANNRVGIGTNAPSHALTVAGTTPQIGIPDGLGNFSTLGVSQGGGGQGNFAISASSASNSIIFQRGSTETMRINSAGSVGIGTSSPSEQLSVSANISATNLYVTSNGDTSTNGISGGFKHGGINSKSLVIEADPNNVGGNTAMRFEVDGSERMRITSAGNVGIGTSSPQDALHIAKASAVLRLEDTDTSHISTIQSGNAGLFITADATNTVASSFLALSVDGSERMRITSAGNVGIGTSAPLSDQRVTIVGSATGSIPLGLGSNANFATIQSYGNSPLHINALGNNTILNPSFGNVGIGTTSPSQALHVIGNILASGNITAFSDIRLKTDLEAIPDALAKVQALTGYTFERTDTGDRQTGVIAQEVQKVLPEAVSDTGEYMSVAYGNMVGLLIEAIKEQQAQIEELKARLEN
jgi:hypothetical protein